MRCNRWRIFFTALQVSISQRSPCRGGPGHQTPCSTPSTQAWACRGRPPAGTSPCTAVGLEVERPCRSAATRPSTRDRKGPAVPFTRCDRGHREQPGDHACVAARLRIRPAQGPRRGTGGRLEKREAPPAVVDEEDDRVELEVERLGLAGGVSRQQLLLVVPEDVGQAGWQGAWWRVDSFVYR